jgi:hypothetical protein
MIEVVVRLDRDTGKTQIAGASRTRAMKVRGVESFLPAFSSAITNYPFVGFVFLFTATSLIGR